jgi:hypothetical protein
MMLVFIKAPDGRNRLAGNCDLALPAPGVYDGVRFTCANGAVRSCAVASVGFRRRAGTAIDVIVLDAGDDPAERPGFRPADGRA